MGLTFFYYLRRNRSLAVEAGTVREALDELVARYPSLQSRILQGDGVLLRYPQMSDYAQWSKLRDESREFLAPWEPTWAVDELSRGAFRRRLRRYQR